MDVEKRNTSRKQLTEQEPQVKLPNIYLFLKTSYANDEKGCDIWAGEKTKDSHEWWDFKGFIRRKPPHRQEAAYEFEDAALAAKSEQELPL